nr:tetratricopeptide repeat protein [Syntrophobacterales bacterium]
ALEKAGKTQEAAKHYRKVLELNPDDADALMRLADMEMKNKNYDQVIKLYEKALPKVRNKGAVYANLGFAYGEIKVYKSSAENYERALKAGFKSPQLHYNLAYAYSKLGRRKEAISNYEKYAALQPTENVLNILADAYMREKRYDDAIRISRRLLNLTKKKAGAYANLGRAYGAKGDADRAIEMYKQSLKYDSEDDAVFAGLGEAYEKKGLYQEALNAYQTAYQLNPESARAARKIPALKIKIMQDKHRAEE